MGKRPIFTDQFKTKIALEALTRLGKPEIFNTDQGCKVTTVTAAVNLLSKKR